MALEVSYDRAGLWIHEFTGAGIVRKQLGLAFDGKTLGDTYHLVIGDVQLKGLDQKVS